MEAKENDKMDPKSSTTDQDALSYIYKEHVRLSEITTSFINSSFEDFKIIGSVGALLAWAPISASIVSFGNGFGFITSQSYSIVLLIGFIVTLFVIIINMMRDLLKQSLIRYYIEQVRLYEEKIRFILGEPVDTLFSTADNWEKWKILHYKRILYRFFWVFAPVIVVFPATILAFQKPAWYAFIYLAIAIVLLGVYVSGAKIMDKAY